MKITIGSQVSDLQSKAGKPYKKFNAKDESGKIFQDVVAFPFFGQYASIVPNAVIEGEIKDEGVFNGKPSYKLSGGNLGAKSASFGGGAKAMETKAANIKVAQERKEGAIEISATARDATLIVTTFYKDLKPEEIKKQWIYWRRWLLNNWDNTTNANLTSHGDPVPTFERPSEDIDPESIPF